MKRIPLYFLLILTTQTRAQEKQSLYVFDANWNPTKMDSAHFLLRVHQVNDSCWQWDYYNIIGPLLKTEQFRDKNGNELDGISHYYNGKGWLDSTASFRKGRKNGDFYKLRSDTFTIALKYKYLDDSLVEVIDTRKPKKDSAVVYKDEKESEYPGGVGQWIRYLNKNIKYPERAVNNNIEGEVRVSFIVDKEGKVQDSYIARSVEYTLDDESLRMVRGSGKWVPAFQNGKVVKSYKVQPIVFSLK
jgi:protein TonB